MDVWTGGGEGCIIRPKGAVESWAFAISGPEMVDFVQVVRVTEVDFVGGDANMGPAMLAPVPSVKRKCHLPYWSCSSFTRR